MSNRSRSSSKRASTASKQHRLLESFKRGEKKTAVVDEEEPTVIDLDDDDPVSENYGQILISNFSISVCDLSRVSALMCELVWYELHLNLR